MSDPTPSRRLAGDDVLAHPLVRELLDARLIGVLATLDPSGTIHAVPMWYAAAESAVILATSSASRKVVNLRHDSRATLVLHDSRPGCEVCGVSLVGRVEIVPPIEAESLVELVHRRYVTEQGAAEPAVSRFLASDDVALRFIPSSALSWDERASDAAQALRSRGGALPLVPTDPRD
jgi:nitroimidazol reductase NimA-like FMN-containing flavoprotein (pyridoxamine 5'-phosphate oxidase superfamily)